ncbi:transposable element Tc1 transposase [Trichonephila clavipes]|nr:transposable element Tc1 transposase [Trichonephila clavipes]
MIVPPCRSSRKLTPHSLRNAEIDDESHFQQCPDNHRRRGWKRPGQCADPTYTIAHRTDLNQVLWSAVPFLLIAGSLWFSLEAHLQHSAYKIHRWTSRLPDLSPIKHIWDAMGRLLHLLGNVDDLSQQLEQIWQEILQENIRVLYHSMPRRVAASIQARDFSQSLSFNRMSSLQSKLEPIHSQKFLATNQQSHQDLEPFYQPLFQGVCSAQNSKIEGNFFYEQISKYYVMVINVR